MLYCQAYQKVWYFSSIKSWMQTWIKHIMMITFIIIFQTRLYMSYWKVYIKKDPPCRTKKFIGNDTSIIIYVKY